MNFLSFLTTKRDLRFWASIVFIVFSFVIIVFSSTKTAYGETTTECIELNGPGWTANASGRCVAPPSSSPSDSPTPATPSGTCTGFLCQILDAFTSGISNTVGFLISLIVVPIFAGILRFVAFLFDATVYYSIFEMSKITGSGTSGGVGQGIAEAWGVVRDLLNLFLIFWLVWIGIKTILGMEDFKKIIPAILMFALLTNFSFYFSKLIIDATNILGLQFYSAVLPNGITDPLTFGRTSTAAGVSAGSNTGISAKIMQNLGIDGIVAGLDSGDKTKSIVGIGIVDQLFVILLLIVSSFLLVQGAAIFIVRIVSLIFLLVLSPLMFARNIVPQITTYAKKWWDMFWCECYVAPVFMLLLYLAIRISDGLVGVSSILGGGSSASGGSYSTFGSLFRYVIVAGLFIFVLNNSKKIACMMGEATNGFAKSVGTALVGGGFGALGMAGRATVGRAAANLKQSNWMQGQLAKNTFGAKLLYNVADTTSKASMDATRSETFRSGLSKATMGGVALKEGTAGKGGYEGVLDVKQKKRMEERDKFRQTLKVTDRQIDTLSREKTAELLEKMDDVDRAKFQNPATREDERYDLLKKYLQRERDEAYEGTLKSQGIIEGVQDTFDKKVLRRTDSTYGSVDARKKREYDKEKAAERRTEATKRKADEAKKKRDAKDAEKEVEYERLTTDDTGNKMTDEEALKARRDTQEKIESDIEELTDAPAKLEEASASLRSLSERRDKLSEVVEKTKRLNQNELEKNSLLQGKSFDEAVEHYGEEIEKARLSGENLTVNTLEGKLEVLKILQETGKNTLAEATAGTSLEIATTERDVSRLDNLRKTSRTELKKLKKKLHEAQREESDIKELAKYMEGLRNRRDQASQTSPAGGGAPGGGTTPTP